MLWEADDLGAGLHTLTTADMGVLADLEHSYTMWAGDKPIACAGLNGNEAWAFLSADVKPYMLPLVRAMRRFLTIYAPDKVVAAVDVDYEPGHRLVRALGFVPAGILLAHSVDGRDHLRYTRTR